MTAVLEAPRVIRPNPGPQEAYLGCTADVAIYGGAAGGGKTWGTLYDHARWAATVRGYAGVIFRKSYPQIAAPGALWDESMNLYPLMGGSGVRSDMRWMWHETGSWVKFSYLASENDMYNWQGSQLAVATFEELTHFPERAFWYIMSRLRTMCPMRPYLRGTCNPEPGHWVSKLIEWWIDQKTGFAIPERSGVIRYFIRQGEKILWADKREDLPEEVVNGTRVGARSFTFISAKVTDNLKLLEAQPEYLATLRALPFYERQLLLDGNWKVRRECGMRFKREWFGAPEAPPALSNFVRVLRYWDRASTEPNSRNTDPDYTAGVKIGEDKWGNLWILDVARTRTTPNRVRQFIARKAQQDGPECELWLEEDPGSAGQAEKSDLSRDLGGYAPRFKAPTGSKWTRSDPASSAAENGRLRVAIGDWNEDFLVEAEEFIDEDTIKPPPGYHDDQVDGMSGGVNVLSRKANPGIN